MMMKPFAATPLEQDERVFNYRLSQSRGCVENAFWHTGQLLGLPTHSPSTKPQNVEIILNACITLNNMLRTAGADDAGCWNWHTCRYLFASTRI